MLPLPGLPSPFCYEHPRRPEHPRKDLIAGRICRASSSIRYEYFIILSKTFDPLWCLNIFQVNFEDKLALLADLEDEFTLTLPAKLEDESAPLSDLEDGGRIGAAGEYGGRISVGIQRLAGDTDKKEKSWHQRGAGWSALRTWCDLDWRRVKDVLTERSILLCLKHSRPSCFYRIAMYRIASPVRNLKTSFGIKT